MSQSNQQGGVTLPLVSLLFVVTTATAWLYYDLSQSNEFLQTDYDQVELELSNARSETSMNENLVGQLLSQADKLNQQIKGLIENEQDNKTKMDQQVQLNNSLENEILELTSQLNEKQGELSESRGNVDVLQAELDEVATTEQLFLAAREQLAFEQSENETFSETISRLKVEMAAELKAMSQFEAQLQTRLKQVNAEKQQLVTQLEDGTTAIKLPESILFSSGSARLSEEGTQTLSVLAEALKSFPNHLISIQGHTDSRKISWGGQYPSNWELSSARASTAVRELINQGVPMQQLQAVGFADTRPLFKEKDEASFQQNRRIEVILFPNKFKIKLLKAG